MLSKEKKNIVYFFISVNKLPYNSNLNAENIQLTGLSQKESAILFLHYYTKELCFSDIDFDVNDNEWRKNNPPTNPLELIALSRNFKLCQGLPNNIMELALKAKEKSLLEITPESFLPAKMQAQKAKSVVVEKPIKNRTIAFTRRSISKINLYKTNNKSNKEYENHLMSTSSKNNKDQIENNENENKQINGRILNSLNEILIYKNQNVAKKNINEISIINESELESLIETKKLKDNLRENDDNKVDIINNKFKIRTDFFKRNNNNSNSIESFGLNPQISKNISNVSSKDYNPTNDKDSSESLSKDNPAILSFNLLKSLNSSASKNSNSKNPSNCQFNKQNINNKFLFKRDDLNQINNENQVISEIREEINQEVKERKSILSLNKQRSSDSNKNEEKVVSQLPNIIDQIRNEKSINEQDINKIRESSSNVTFSNITRRNDSGKIIDSSNPFKKQSLIDLEINNENEEEEKNILSRQSSKISIPEILESKESTKESFDLTLSESVNEFYKINNKKKGPQDRKSLGFNQQEKEKKRKKGKPSGKMSEKFKKKTKRKYNDHKNKYQHKEKEDTNDNEGNEERNENEEEEKEDQEENEAIE